MIKYKTSDTYKNDYEVFYEFHKNDKIYEDTFKMWSDKGYIHMNTSVHGDEYKNERND